MQWGGALVLWTPLLNGDVRRPFTLSSRLITPYNGPQCGLYESFYHVLRRIFMTDSKDVFYGSPLPFYPPILGVKGSQGSLHCLHWSSSARLLLPFLTNTTMWGFAWMKPLIKNLVCWPRTNMNNTYPRFLSPPWKGFLMSLFPVFWWARCQQKPHPSVRGQGTWVWH